MPGTTEDTQIERHDLPVRVLEALGRASQFGGLGDQVEELGRWLNNPPDERGIAPRLAVMSGLFGAAILITVTLCVLTYWVVLGVQLVFY